MFQWAFDEPCADDYGFLLVINMKNNGWILLYRKLKDTGYYKKSQYVHLWIHLLLTANHEPKEFMWNKEIIIIKDGQLLTGRKQLSKETGIPETTIERALEFFVKNGHQIEQQKTTKFRIITIVNWKEYQTEKHKVDKKTDNRRTTDGQQMDTNNNVKNDNNDKEVLATGVADNLNPLIELFKPINPSYGRLYANKTQRGALQRLVDKHGAEKIAKILETIQKTNQVKYAPTITTPLELENKLATLLLFLKREQGVSQSVKL